MFVSRVLGRNLTTFYKKGCYSCRIGRLIGQRSFSSKSTTENIDVADISLGEAIPLVSPPKYAVPGQKAETQVTTLDNGLRVSTENSFGQFCTVGVVIDSGSRYGVDLPGGITHFLEKLAFGTTDQFKNKDMIQQDTEKISGTFDCQGSRDTLIYAMSVNTAGVEKAIEILSEVTLKPHFTDEEFADSRSAIEFELQVLDMNPDPQQLLTEMIHKAGYSRNTLGLPKICPAENVSLIDRGMLYTYLKQYHTPERMVVAGAGIDHDILVDLVQKHFVSKTPVWEEKKELIDSSIVQDLSVSQYTGGSTLVEKDLSNVSMGPTPIPDLAHIVIGLESCSHGDPDFIALCVLNLMLGGGGAFSSGGPGKGMYTRLYLNVLNRYHWIYNATAYNESYYDSGIFYIHASADPKHLRDLVEVITKEIVAIQHGIGQVELKRARTQLQSMLLMNLESKPVIFEDIGRQVLAHRKRFSAQHYYDQIGKITEEDIVRVAQRMLKTPPAVAALGNLKNLPRQEDIWTALHRADGKLPKKFALFQ